ncbi:BAHD acyltransferase At5g47980-like [Euphorbia lathyris]|uniref:BAHD acyltransferase At5g47980-like n=1 Tax=Euphorbia lathyris TaxID=212925 RepID=UPI0033133FE6
MHIDSSANANFLNKEKANRKIHEYNIKIAPKMQPEIISREIIKPTSSSPYNHPNIHKLSFFDQTSPCVYIPLLIFYTTKHTSSVLKNSLSATLSEFYPLAGRTKDDVTVDCNDDGVVFLEATMGCNLSELLKSPDDETLKLLLPDGLYYKDFTLSSPVVVQVTYFQCGGMSIGLCLSHKIQDMESICAFLKKWASVARNSDNEITPDFDIASLYPPLDLPFLKNQQPAQEMNNCASRRVVFRAGNVSKLKEIAADHVLNPTRVEVVASLLYKSAISAVSKVSKASSSGSSEQSVMHHVMNLRTKVSPPLSERKAGNLTGVFPVSAKEADFGVLVKEFREEKTRFSDSCGKVCDKEELYMFVLDSMKGLGTYFSDENEKVYFCSSWCRYPFYEIDFGWGKPFWVTTVFWAMKNLILMIDAKGGDGIEAFVTLDERAMAVFEKDQELLSFSSVNPSVFQD